LAAEPHPEVFYRARKCFIAAMRESTLAKTLTVQLSEKGSQKELGGTSGRMRQI
jgi:hypothetical protein